MITLDGTLGITTPAETVQGALTTTGNTILGDASTDTLNVGNGGLVKDASGNVGIGTAGPNAKLQVDSGSATYSANIRARNSNFGSGVVGAASGILTIATDMNNIAFYPASNLGVDGTSAPTNEQARITSAGLLQFNSGYGSVATAYGCRAWVNFNGTGVVAIRASGNVSSITDNGTGDYTVNFTTAMVDANYGYEVSGREDESATLTWGALAQPARVAQTTTTFRIITKTAAGAAFDFNSVSLAVFR